MVVLLGCIHSLKFISCTPKNGNISLYVNYMSIKQTLRLKFYNFFLFFFLFSGFFSFFRNTNSIKWARNTQQLLQILFTRQQGFHLKPSYSKLWSRDQKHQQHCPESFLEMQTLRSQPRSTESKYVYYQELQVSPMYNIHLVYAHFYCYNTLRRQSTTELTCPYKWSEEIPVYCEFSLADRGTDWTQILRVQRSTLEVVL